MSAALDLARLVKVKIRGGKLICQCPACAAAGADKTGDHLVIFEEGHGKWGCVAFAGDKEHRRQIVALVGAENSQESPKPIAPRIPTQAVPRKLELPSLRVPTVGELAQLAELRGLPLFAGLELAARAGQLRCAEIHDTDEAVSAWVLLDSSHRCAQARRLDGIPWRCIGNKKAMTLSGSQGAWPIGAADIGDKPFVALCEGGPDTLAAWTIAWWHGQHHEIAPVCMAGSPPIHTDALPNFLGKGVFTVPHRDAAGACAQKTWTAQLRAAGALWVKSFDVSPHKDLNEFLTAAAANLGDEL
jgi:hypothetical protein